MTTYLQKQYGFTIAELVIVVAVIGILAAISIPAYNGVQQRARNTIRIDFAGQFTDIIRIALTKNTADEMSAAMDPTDGWEKACLGTDYQDINADGRGDCATWLNTPYASDTTAFSTMLAKTALPSVAKYPVIKSTTGMVLYGQYATSAVINGETLMTLEYALEGLDQDCVYRPLIYRNGSSISMTPWGDPKYTVSANGVTECRVAVSKVR